MAYWVYILKSETSGRYYCGHTEDLTRRLSQHNDPEYHGSRTTKVFKGPWQLIWSSETESRGEAVVLERKIKKRGIHRYLEDVSSVVPRLRWD
ncbi:MAG: GIY-YIG nuclease family protein [Pseudomonadota bacterium]